MQMTVAPRIAACAVLAFATLAHAQQALKLTIGCAQRLTSKDATAGQWTASDQKVAQVFQNGFVIGLAAGDATVGNGSAKWAVTVVEDDRPIVLPASLKQFPDSRRFEVDGRLCFGSELNGRRADEPEERKFTDSNRVINPKPLRQD